ncbi:uncharacterized protein LOC114744196 [Neltuma alba]|uniref:uncharacterized protein LOC114744196 n=1 Tax=Neltuma alba TaxID=207710 RepID=UPI0010A3EF7D|nr:uncharacterized protein LOC114744196 [Prosopis alba]
MEEVEKGRLKPRIFINQQSRSRQWIPPEAGTIRVDVDASVLENGQAACGGMIMDDQGRWITGFKKCLGVLPVVATELVAIHIGLEACKSFQLPNVQLCSGSMEAINMISRDSGANHPLYNEIERVKHLLHDGQNVQVNYSIREAIQCADILAKAGHPVGPQTVLVTGIDPTCRRRFMEDFQGLRRTKDPPN